MTDRATLMKRAALAAIATAATLACVKLAAWGWTGSVAMLASFADSALDLAASALNALAIRFALSPADREHRFGHGKTEAVAGLAQGALMLASSGFLIWESINRLLVPQPIDNGMLGLGIALFSIAATLALTLYQRRVIRATGSLAISADHLHYVTDLVSNLAVVVALVLAVWLGIAWADGAFGLLIAALIGWSAFAIFRQSFDQLLDHELPDADRDRIKAAAAAVPGVLDVHDLRTRQSGTHAFVQLHAVFDGALTLEEAHALSDRVEAAVLAVLPNAEVLVHSDPSNVLESRRPLAFVAG
ncbi:MAG: cation diffusion facilitator family transporter [Micropepsaceae bacterium]